eukprot:9293373-Pyramimonas_sp.AAC.1
MAAMARGARYVAKRRPPDSKSGCPRETLRPLGAQGPLRLRRGEPRLARLSHHNPVPRAIIPQG